MLTLLIASLSWASSLSPECESQLALLRSQMESAEPAMYEALATQAARIEKEAAQFGELSLPGEQPPAIASAIPEVLEPVTEDFLVKPPAAIESGILVLNKLVAMSKKQAIPADQLVFLYFFAPNSVSLTTDDLRSIFYVSKFPERFIGQPLVELSPENTPRFVIDVKRILVSETLEPIPSPAYNSALSKGLFEAVELALDAGAIAFPQHLNTPGVENLPERVLRKLIQAGADPSKPIDHKTPNALFLRTRWNSDMHVRVLLENGANLEAKNLGLTPLGFAINAIDINPTHSEIRYISALINACADVNAPMPLGMTVFQRLEELSCKCDELKTTVEVARTRAQTP